MRRAQNAEPFINTGGGSLWVKNASTEIRRGFVRKVYGLLSVQLFITFIIAGFLQGMSLEWQMQHQWMVGLSFMVTFGTLCAMTCCQDVCRNFPTNYLLLFGFTIFEGILIGFISAQYTAGSVTFCVGVTAAVFLGLTLYACTTKTDFTGFGVYLYGALMAFCCFGLGIWLLSMCGIHIPGVMLVYNLGGVLLFVGYIIFDTQMILGEMGGHKFQFGIDDYVFAALTLYLDIINLFLYLLRLFGERKN